MENKLNCFVIIGFGKKTSYANGTPRVLDLDETYELLIKPVFDELNINCYRAIDKNLVGSIDKLMLQEIKDADVALVDVSTLNANVMWELGVRHALKPHHTIMICEKEQMSSIPFDINHFIIHQYAHSEEGIPYKEVDRFRRHLKKLVQDVLSQDPIPTDSPVHTFLGDELGLRMENEEEGPSFSSLIKEAEKTKSNREFKEAIALFKEAKEIAISNASLKDDLAFIIGRLALCTYKLKEPSEEIALNKAYEILLELNPEQSMDVEVLGLSGAINKRLYEINGDLKFLEKSISFYERGFSFKKDYYNGINAAFMLYAKSAYLKKNALDWEDAKTEADYFRNATLKISLKLENETDFNERGDAVWVLLTIAEAYNYKGNDELVNTYEQKGREVAKKKNDSFAMDSYLEQKKKIEVILNQINH